MSVDDRVRSMLTVEEAAGVLRIGRTKAYALATEWRITGGKSGLPVVDFGHVLRVPRHQLELLIGGPFEAVSEEPEEVDRVGDVSTVPSAVDTPADENATAPDAPIDTNAARQPRRKHRQPDNQLDLFNPDLRDS